MTVHGIFISVLIAVTLVGAILLFVLMRRLREAHAQSRKLHSELASAVALARAAAAADERKRLLADLHDDIGAKLTTLLHAVDNPQQADLVRAIVQDFRDVVSRTNQDACTLLQALAQMREETEQRVEAAMSHLDWQQSCDLPDPPLDEAQVLHLFRIVREALTNALRHGGAKHIRVRIQQVGCALLLDFTDDGPGLRDGSVRSGRGTHGMRDRAQQLSGTIDWTPGTHGGTKVILEFPLPKH